MTIHWQKYPIHWHDERRMTIQSSSTTYWHEELIRSHMSWIWLLGTEIGLNWMWGLLYNDHAWLKLKCRPSYIDIPSCRPIQMCSLWLESDSSYHADSLMICGHRVRVCWRYFHWIWFKSSQNLRISLWSPLAITKTTRSVSISASHSDPHTWW